MTKSEDRELEAWREQWHSVAEPLPEINRKIKRQNFWFLANNLAALCSVIAALAFAAWAVRQDPSRLRIAWGIGVVVLVVIAVGYRLWNQRGTWRAEAQSTRAFVELWQRRVISKLRLVRLAFYLIPAWLIFCVVLMAANWSVFGSDMRIHPKDWLETFGIIVLLLLASFAWLAWYRRRKLRELDEVRRILDEMKD